MRIADLSTGSARLHDALETLAAKWADTREHWDDANSRNLEENHLKPLGDEVMAALAAVQHLAEIIARAQRECERGDA